MKKIYIIDTWRRMKRTLVTFFSIIIIICLGISSYLGIGFAKMSMEETGDDYYTKNKFHNFEINYSYGITDEDIEKIGEIKGIDAAEGVFRSTGFLKTGNSRRLVTVQSATEQVDIASVADGRLPEKKNEIAIEKVMAEDDNISIGDEIEIDCTDSNGLNLLFEKKFKVVGIVEHPAYSCNYVYSRRGVSEKGNGNCLNYFLVSDTAFNLEATDNCYQGALVWSDKLKQYNCFSDEYEQESDKLKQSIIDFSEEQSLERYNIVKEEAEAAGNDAGEIVKVNWNVYDRGSNVSFAMYSDNAEGLGKLSFSFAFVYIVVAFMVCYSSIGRMITKQKMLIGTQKALGFRSGEIRLQYLAYVWVCTFWGCVSGVLWAVFFVQKLSLKSYKPIYYFREYISVCDWGLTITVTICTFILSSLAVLVACRKQINKPAVLLLRDEMVGDGKEFFFEKWFFWKKISLFKRTIVKNLINEKRHMVTTVIGIAGCTALMVIGFTLKFAITDVKEEQFNKIQKFDLNLQIETGTDEKIYADELDKFDKLEYIGFMDKMVGVSLNGKDDIVADLLCTDAAEMTGYFLLTDESTGKTVSDYQDGVLLSANTARYYNIKVDDEIQILKQNGEKIAVPVIGIVKNYVCHFIVMTPDYYQKIMDEKVQNNMYFIKQNGVKQNELEGAVETKEGYIALSGKDMGISIFNNIAESLNSVIEVMICLSAIMALVVVLNLIMMYINEKSKTLAVMRINGFSIRQVKAFISFSNVILNIVGLAAGIAVGIILGIQIVTIIENDCVAYNRDPNLLACILSSGICIVYSFVVGVIANRKINNLPLTNLNRFE